MKKIPSPVPDLDFSGSPGVRPAGFFSFEPRGAFPDPAPREMDPGSDVGRRLPDGSRKIQPFTDSKGTRPRPTFPPLSKTWPSSSRSNSTGENYIYPKKEI
jgi:hypothetical protein